MGVLETSRMVRFPGQMENGTVDGNEARTVSASGRAQIFASSRCCCTAGRVDRASAGLHAQSAKICSRRGWRQLASPDARRCTELPRAAGRSQAEEAAPPVSSPARKPGCLDRFELARSCASKASLSAGPQRKHCISRDYMLNSHSSHSADSQGCSSLQENLSGVRSIAAQRRRVCNTVPSSPRTPARRFCPQSPRRP